MENLKFKYEIVSMHYNQTTLVERLLKEGLIDYGEIRNLNYRDVFQWVLFNNFDDYFYEKLETAGIPTIRSELGYWVGITSYGSHYDCYVYPELINAIWGDELGEISYSDIQKLTK